MADELIDRLDENGKKIGTIMKSEAHKIGAWHRSIHLLLVNDENKILIQQRAADKALYPNMWDISVGGHVAAGEKTITAAQRELSEELGINAAQKDFKPMFTYKETLQQGDFLSKEFVDVYLLHQNVKSEDIKLQQEEVSNFKFIPLTELFERAESKDPTLMPHWEEYERAKAMLLPSKQYE